MYKMSIESVRCLTDLNNFVAVLLCFSEAFGSIQHAILFGKLRGLSYDRVAVQIIGSLMKNRSQKHFY